MQTQSALLSVISHHRFSLGPVHWSRPNAWLKLNIAAIGFHSLPSEPEVRREDALLQPPAAPQHTATITSCQAGAIADWMIVELVVCGEELAAN